MAKFKILAYDPDQQQTYFGEYEALTAKEAVQQFIKNQLLYDDGSGIGVHPGFEFMGCFSGRSEIFLSHEDVDTYL